MIYLPQGNNFAEFGAGCFWGVELAFQRVPGVSKTEVGYSQGFLDNPSYEDICTGLTNHSEVVRVMYDPKEYGYDDLLDLFWSRRDPTILNRQCGDVGTQYRSGIYFYTPEQENAAIESRDHYQKHGKLAYCYRDTACKEVYRVEEYHQQYLAKGAVLGSGSQRRKVATTLFDAMVDLRQAFHNFAAHFRIVFFVKIKPDNLLMM